MDLAAEGGIAVDQAGARVEAKVSASALGQVDLAAEGGIAVDQDGARVEAKLSASALSLVDLDVDVTGSLAPTTTQSNPR